MKFSIREIMLVTVIVALAVGWWVEHRQNAVLKQENELLQIANDFMAGTWDQITNELNRKRQQLGEPVALQVEEEANDNEIRIRQLGETDSLLPNSSTPAPNPKK